MGERMRESPEGEHETADPSRVTRTAQAPEAEGPIQGERLPRVDEDLGRRAHGGYPNLVSAAVALADGRAGNVRAVHAAKTVVRPLARREASGGVRGVGEGS